MRVETLAFGGTAVIIVVGVALDTIHQVEGQMLMRHYDGILKRRGKSGGLL
jgi:preprotein translocase subunit SecY